MSRQNLDLKVFQAEQVDGRWVLTEWPKETSLEFVAGHAPDYHVARRHNLYWHFFSDGHLSEAQANHLCEQILQRRFVPIQVDLRTASNPVSERKPAMKRKGKK